MEIQAMRTTMIDLTSRAQTQAASTSAATDKTGQSAAPKAGGAPPVGGGGGAKPAAASETSSSSSTDAKIYDKRDTNKDGTVSYQEAMLYAIQHPADDTQSDQTVSASQMKTALKAYQQGEPTDSTTSSVLS